MKSVASRLVAIAIGAILLISAYFRTNSFLRDGTGGNHF